LRRSAQKSSKWVYTFRPGHAEGAAKDNLLLGGKGAGLAEMCGLGLPVPPGFTLSTRVCEYFYENQGHYPEYLKPQVKDAMSALERLMGRRFGDSASPLLVSVRSGAPVSMPGMMDTILNVGLNDATAEGLSREFKDPRFARDSYRRLVQMYGDIVMEVPHNLFEEALKKARDKEKAHQDRALSPDALSALIAEFKAIIRRVTGKEFPQDPLAQLWGAIDAVFGSWMSRRAVTYRKLNGISDALGTAVTVQAMVFGNRGEDSATGVLFTRNPVDGTKALYGEYLINAQGEDVVAGMRNPENLSDTNKGHPVIDKKIPGIHKDIAKTVALLEKHFRDVQDVEFTIEQAKLWLLQTRTAKRTTAAAVKIAVDMAREKLISEEEALNRIVPDALYQLLHPTIDYVASPKVLTKGLAASPGAASGIAVFSPDEAEKLSGAGKDVILVREATSPEDIHGMHAAKGILTASGGMTSHAAVVARGMGRPCVCGASEMMVKESKGFFRVGDKTVKAGQALTIDGSTGNVMLGHVAMVQPTLPKELGTLLAWADRAAAMTVRANADTPEDCRKALQFDAKGIGLCRTEHMFFDPKRITVVRRMILAENPTERLVALAKIKPMQRKDFVEIFRLMKSLPVTVRLLDPPLHEFLPRTPEEVEQVAKEAGLKASAVKRRIAQLHEVNPMLGHRGCRLGISYPEIYDMQTEAILEAAAEVQAGARDWRLDIEIMVPFVANVSEMALWRERIKKVAHAVLKGKARVDYAIGTMIELPRACITADEIAEEVDFFSFGTNDLTQTAIGLSRDDTSDMLSDYLTEGLISKDPFRTIDRKGVGTLVEMAVRLGRGVKKGLKCGVCGEHGGDPDSVDFFHTVGLDYVSCSPFRVPGARLAAAQAALRHRGTNNGK
jgi:pyruvate, orthophosphate dikinase